MYIVVINTTQTNYHKFCKVPLKFERKSIT